MRGLGSSTFRRACCLAVVGALFCTTVGLEADVLSLRPFGRPTGKLGQALDMIARGQLRSADTLLQEVIEKEPGQVMAPLAQAQIAVTERRLEAAEKSVTDVLKREPTRPEAHNMQGVVALLQNEPVVARRAFEREIELQADLRHPDDVSRGPRASERQLRTRRQSLHAAHQVAPRFPAGYLGTAEAQIMMLKRPTHSPRSRPGSVPIQRAPCPRR